LPTVGEANWERAFNTLSKGSLDTLSMDWNSLSNEDSITRRDWFSKLYIDDHNTRKPLHPIKMDEHHYARPF
jgi:hypothetical protein